MRILRTLRVLVYIWHIQVKYRDYRHSVQHPASSLFGSLGWALIMFNSLATSVATVTGYLHH